MKPIACCFMLLAIGCSAALAADPQPLLTVSGRTLLSEEFSQDALPPTFRTLQTPDSFQVVDGALQVAAQSGQERATHGAFPVEGHNLTVSFSVKFVQAGTLYIGVDGYKEEFNGNTHLVRFSLTPERMGWDEKRGGPESKRAVSEAARAARRAKQPVPQPTPEQLADPSFFRTVELAARKIACAADQWHEVLLEVHGNELVAQVNGQTLVASATVADAAKNRIGIGLTGRGTVLIDNFRVYENSPRADWQQVRARLVTSTEVQGEGPAR